jgi:hypothetical protein
MTRKHGAPCTKSVLEYLLVHESPISSFPNELDTPPLGNVRITKAATLGEDCTGGLLRGLHGPSTQDAAMPLFLPNADDTSRLTLLTDDLDERARQCIERRTGYFR